MSTAERVIEEMLARAVATIADVQADQLRKDISLLAAAAILGCLEHAAVDARGSRFQRKGGHAAVSLSTHTPPTTEPMATRRISHAYQGICLHP
ncbi:hypothetical protein ACP93_14750 [Xanthomonas sp. NCPPB 1128]|uniref:hypothetical protein n=1 Tax=Xanthomonas sp. NCPPB 1128 TaxID=1775876 RepID=UPI00065AC0C2|nr:hypothetical protein ACP93_14750 [Xanthomonas sp. NCPPB 1128]